MSRHPGSGLLLAMCGALVLTPDALFMRLSEMSGTQMMGWRGLFMGVSLITIWLLSSRTRWRDLSLLSSGAAAVVVGGQFCNQMLFALGIATAPVAIVLFGLATVPIWAAVFGWLWLKEQTGVATWVTIVAVVIGISIAVLGGGAGTGVSTHSLLLGALAGLGVAIVLALCFVVLRAEPDLPIPLLIGLGALCAGATGASVIGPAHMLEGQLWAIAVCGILILPVSFLSLMIASRHTAATNVSLLMLLETVLGPIWVWLVLDETMTAAMLLGGAVVVGAIAAYLLYKRGQSQKRQRRQC